MTGFITGGSGSFSQGLGAATVINVGGSLTGSAIKGENPNAGMGGAAVGTAVGLPAGKAIEVPINKAMNPWYRPDWIPGGFFGIVNGADRNRVTGGTRQLL